MDPTDLLKLLVDPERLAVVGALAVRERSTEEIAAETGKDARTVVETVGRLVQAGLAVRNQDRYQLDPKAWREVARALTDPPSAPDDRIGFGMTAEEREILGRYFEESRLSHLPRGRDARRTVLERLALEFEPGVHYPESEVNDLLGQFHEDVATLRRALVDHGYLDRDAGEYWRSGGRLAEE